MDWINNLKVPLKYVMAVYWFKKICCYSLSINMLSYILTVYLYVEINFWYSHSFKSKFLHRLVSRNTSVIGWRYKIKPRTRFWSFQLELICVLSRRCLDVECKKFWIVGLNICQSNIFKSIAYRILRATNYRGGAFIKLHLLWYL